MSKGRFYAIFFLLVGVTGLTFRGLFDARLREFKISMQSAADKALFLRTLGLISKVRLMRSSLAGAENIRHLISESNLRLTQMDAAPSVVSDEPPTLTTKLGLAVINFINFLAGTPFIRERSSQPHEIALERAYAHELQRAYAPAILAYDAALRAAQNADQSGFASFVQLHRGYCRLFTGQLDDAIRDYEDVIARHKDGEFRLTAEVLLTYAREMRHKIQEANKIRGHASRGVAMFQAGAYAQALESFAKLQKQSLQVPEIYAMARSYEETGEKSQALSGYRQIIEKNSENKYAKMANRRIYAMGVLYETDEKLRDESGQNARTRLRDSDLMKLDVKTSHLYESLRRPPSGKIENHNHELETNAKESQEQREAPPVKSSQTLPVSRAFVTTAPTFTSVYHDFDALSREERAQVLSANDSIHLLVLHDGNRIFGRIVSESAQAVAVNTLMGKVEFLKNGIKRIENISAANRIKRD